MQYCVCGTEKCRGGLYLNSQRPLCFSASRQVISVSLPPRWGKLNDPEGFSCAHKLTELRVFGSWCDATRGSLVNPIPYPCINIVNYPNRNFTFQFFQKFSATAQSLLRRLTITHSNFFSQPRRICRQLNFYFLSKYIY